jgi:hypothetical protein
MEPRLQINMMDKILRQMDDVKKSQTAVLKKLTQIEVENINLNSTLLSDALPGIHTEIDESIKKMGILLESFKDQKIDFESKHRPSEAA